ncbi:MAG: hypothetical protein QME81_04545 [bacterium]|nr:hypothetical protein [bacterium]
MRCQKNRTEPDIIGNIPQSAIHIPQSECPDHFGAAVNIHYEVL